MNRIVQKAFALVLFISGIFFFIGRETGITGATIGLTQVSRPLSVFIAIITIFSGILLFLGGQKAGLEQKIDDANVKSFRRWLEKKEHHKLDYQEAETLYNKVKSEYDNAVKKGIIISGYDNQPLKWVEHYMESKKAFEKWHHAKYDKTNQKKADSDLESIFDELSGKYFQKLKSGELSPEVPIDKFVKMYVEDIYRSARLEKKLALNPAAQYLNDRRIPTTPKELMSIARECGYKAVEEGRTEGISIKKDGSLLTVIPRHNLNRYGSERILKDLATGKPSFRKAA